MELKDSWKEINLGNSATLKARIGWQGLTTAEYLSSGDYFLVTGTDFLNGFIDWNNCVHVEKERYDQDKNIQLQVDDILVTKDGTIGKVAIVDKIVKPTTLNSGVFVIRPLGKSFYPKYLYYILRSGHFADFLSKLTAGSTINHLYQKDFVHYTFPAPPTLEEQRLVADTLSDTDILIQNLKTTIVKKKAIKKGAMQELLTGKKRLRGFTGEWTTKSLEKVTENLVRGPFGGALKKEFFVKDGYKVYEQKNAIYKSISLGKYYIDENKFKELKRFELKSRDFIVSCSGTIGEIFQLPLKFKKGIINQALLKITLDNSIIDDDYFYYQFTSKPFQSKIIDDIQGGAMKNLVGMSVFKETEIEMPSNIKEQKAIAQILSDMDSEIEALEIQLQKTQNLKQGMMQELLTGKIRLIEPDCQSTKKENRSICIAAEPETVYKRN